MMLPLMSKRDCCRYLCQGHSGEHNGVCDPELPNVLLGEGQP